MMIKVLAHYSKRGGISIEAGEYAESDPRLHGLADYLVTNGHAVELPIVPKTTKGTKE